METLRSHVARRIKAALDLDARITFAEPRSLRLEAATPARVWWTGGRNREAEAKGEAPPAMAWWCRRSTCQCTWPWQPLRRLRVH